MRSSEEWVVGLDRVIRGSRRLRLCQSLVLGVLTLIVSAQIFRLAGLLGNWSPIEFALILVVCFAVGFAVARTGPRAPGFVLSRSIGRRGHRLELARSIDRAFGLNEELLSAVDALEDPRVSRSSLLIALLLRVGGQWRTWVSRRLLPEARPAGSLPGLNVALLLVWVGLWIHPVEIDRLESPGQPWPSVVETTGEGSGQEEGAGGASGSEASGAQEGVSDETSDQSPQEDSLPQPTPEFQTDPKFVQPLRRPGADVVKDAVILSEIRARLGRSGGNAPSEAQESSPPETVEAVFERMSEMDVGRHHLSEGDLDFVGRYFEIVRPNGAKE